MRTALLKSNDEKRETLPVARQCMKVVYIRVMDLSLTTLGSTGKVRYETYQLVWSLAMQIVSDNPHAIEWMQRALKVKF